MSIRLEEEGYVENLEATEKVQPNLAQRIIGRGVIASLWAVVFGVVFMLPNWYFHLWHVTFMLLAFLLVLAAVVLCCVACFKVIWFLGSRLGDWSGWNRDMSAGLCTVILTVGCAVLMCSLLLSEWCDALMFSAWNLGLEMPHRPESGHGWFWSHLPLHR